MEKSATDGVVYAEVDGVVKTVGDPDEKPEQGQAFLVVTGDDGLYVKGTISELLLDDVPVGTVVSANSWESGMTFDATITEISDYPVSGNSWGEGNPNVSYYEYTAYIEDSSALRNGEAVDLSISTNQSDGGGIFIEKAYVRSEDGKSYCMIADENNRAEKTVCGDRKNGLRICGRDQVRADGGRPHRIPYGEKCGGRAAAVTRRVIQLLKEERRCLKI